MNPTECDFSGSFRRRSVSLLLFLLVLEILTRGRTRNKKEQKIVFPICTLTSTASD